MQQESLNSLNYLVENLKNYNGNILVNNEKDYNFLINLKKHYQFNYEVFYNDFILINDYKEFNFGKFDFKYDDKINNFIFLCDDILNFKIENLSFTRVIFLINKITKEVTYYNFYEIDKSLLYFDDFIYVAPFKSRLSNYFERKVKLIEPILTLNNFNKNKCYLFLKEEFDKLFSYPIKKEINLYYNSFFIKNIYVNDKYSILDIIIKNNSSKEEIKDILINLYPNMIGFFTLNDNIVSNLYFDYQLMNDILIKYSEDNYFISILELEKSKNTLKLKENENFYNF